MGNNVFMIRTVGCHHNGIHNDGEQIGKRFVDELRSRGHAILGAIHVAGGETNIDLDAEIPRSNVPRPISDDRDSPARAAYERYMTSCEGLNYEGKPCPKWDDLTDAVRKHWAAAVDSRTPRLVR
jgi:hypothetical protein